MTRGTWHVTDVSNACRTLLFDLVDGRLVRRAVRAVRRPARRAARAGAQLGRDRAPPTPRRSCGLELPIAGIAGDQQSALFGQTCFDAGDSKCTYGTGSFILTNTGTSLERSDAGLLSTAAWRSPDGELTYALEGAIFVTGAAVQWLRDGLQIVGSAAETEAIAATVDSSERRRVRAGADRARRPALGPARPRPDHRPDPRHHPRAHRPRHPRGDRLRGARRARHDARRRVRSPCASTAAPPPTTCSARSRPTSSASPSSGRGSSRPPRLGAAFLAGLGTGVWDSTDELRETWQLDRRFEPDRGPGRAPTRPTPAGSDAVERSTGLGRPT